jgi:NAD(P)-dependent dehydrogenase (short-subunit alcohol dehydrogenase family)
VSGRFPVRSQLALLIGLRVKVCFGDRDVTRGEQLALELSNCHFVQCDVTNWDDQVQLFREAVSLSTSGKVDYVVANAGITHADDVFTFDGKLHNCSFLPD